MNLDRSLIKSQAKELMKGKVFILFIIIFAVSLLTSGAQGIRSIYEIKDKNPFVKNSQVQNLLPSPNEGNDIESSDDLEDYLEQFGEDYNYNFNNGNNNGNNNGKSGSSAPINAVTTSVSSLIYIINLILSPLQILLCGLFILIVNGKKFDLYGEFKYVFTNTFDKDYFDKLLLMILSRLFTFLWTLLFIFPGVIYYYKIYFAQYISAENPSLSWKDALTISKKMTNNHKGELFVLDLSFIPWFILTGITLGVAGIYVAPYYQVTKALYYENFKQRALMTGELTPADFMSEAEKYSQFVNAQGGNANTDYYQTQYTVQQNQKYSTPFNGYANEQPYGAASVIPVPDNNQTQPYAEPQQPTYSPVQEENSFYQPTPPVENTPVSEPSPTAEAPVAEETQPVDEAPVVDETPAPETDLQPENNTFSEENEE